MSEKFDESLIGRRLEVKWENQGGEDELFYPGTISDYDWDTGMFFVEYDDGDHEWYDLKAVHFHWLNDENTEEISKGIESALLSRDVDSVFKTMSPFATPRFSSSIIKTENNENEQEMDFFGENNESTNDEEGSIYNNKESADMENGNLAKDSIESTTDQLADSMIKSPRIDGAPPPPATGKRSTPAKANLLRQMLAVKARRNSAAPEPPKESIPPPKSPMLSARSTVSSIQSKNVYTSNNDDDESDNIENDELEAEEEPQEEEQQQQQEEVTPETTPEEPETDTPMEEIPEQNDENENKDAEKEVLSPEEKKKRGMARFLEYSRTLKDLTLLMDEEVGEITGNAPNQTVDDLVLKRPQTSTKRKRPTIKRAQSSTGFIQSVPLTDGRENLENALKGLDDIEEASSSDEEEDMSHKPDIADIISDEENSDEDFDEDRLPSKYNSDNISLGDEPVQTDDLVDNTALDRITKEAPNLEEDNKEVLINPEEDFKEEATVPVPELDEYHNKMEQIVDEVNAEEIPEYLNEFEIEFPPEELIVGAVDVEEIEKQEKAMEEARIQQAELEASRFKQREEELHSKEQHARDRLKTEFQGSQEAIKKRAAQAALAARHREEGIHRLFRRAEDELKATVERQKAMVDVHYGVLEETPLLQAKRGVLRGDKWSVEWRKLPQPVELKLECMRAVRDKLPKGRYCILATLYDRLGGTALRWSSLDEQRMGRPHASQAVKHGGRFYDTELVFNQSIYSVCPGRDEIKPSMVIVLELFLLANKSSQTDRIVGWSVLPASDLNFQVIQGPFRLPFVRGDVDASIERYSDFEQAYSGDLDRWLANMYISVRHLPRTFKTPDGELLREFDVEMAVTSELLKIGAFREEDSSEDDAPPPPMLVPNVKSPTGSSFPLNSFQQPPSPGTIRRNSIFNANGQAGTRRSSAATASSSAPPPSSAAAARKSSIAFLPHFNGLGVNNNTTNKKSTKTVTTTTTTTSTTIMKRSTMRRSHLKRSTIKLPPPRTAQTPQITNMHLSEEALQRFDPCVAKRSNKVLEGNRITEGNRKLKFMKTELLADLGLSRITSGEFWVTLIMIFAALWMRIYTHYISQYIFLRAIGIPIYKFLMQAYSCAVMYNHRVYAVTVDIGAVIAGPAGNVLFFAMLCTIAYFYRRILKSIPTMMSRVLAAWGIAIVLDPLLIIAVDLISGNINCDSEETCQVDVTSDDCHCFEGDAFKLAFRFEREEGSTVVGIVLTVFIYISLLLLSSFAFYSYMVRLHMNGRMLDIYRRLAAPPAAIFTPLDFEVSMAELHWLCNKAKRWRGPDGSKRKISVCQYRVTDPFHKKFEEISLHLAIYTQQLDGTRELYRHFLRLPDGAILELFGDMAAQYVSKSEVLRDLLLSKESKGEEVNGFFTGDVSSQRPVDGYFGKDGNGDGDDTNINDEEFEGVEESKMDNEDAALLV